MGRRVRLVLPAAWLAGCNTIVRFGRDGEGPGAKTARKAQR